MNGTARANGQTFAPSSVGQSVPLNRDKKGQQTGRRGGVRLGLLPINHNASIVPEPIAREFRKLSTQEGSFVSIVKLSIAL